jgi:predicted DNA-binding transcriptional regulator YafY
MDESEPAEPRLRWSVTQRLEFIEFRLVWEGRINRSDIAERFGVTVHQASADLALYEQRAPDNLTYDRMARRFVPSERFAPIFLRPLADRQLLQLAAIGGGLVDPAETWFDALPPISVVSIPHRSVTTATMRWILEAIRTNSLIEIEYQSMKKPEPTRRRIAPHALGHDGVRWHARAWCPKNREFRDFVLSRISAIGALQPAAISPEADLEWSTEIVMILVPNPTLSEGARRSLVKEYGMTRGQLRIPTRAALAFYTIQHLDLDLDDLPPERRQLVLVNKDEVEKACEAASAMTKAAIESIG